MRFARALQSRRGPLSRALSTQTLEGLGRWISIYWAAVVHIYIHTYTHTYLLNLPFCNPTWPPSFFSAGDGGGDKPGQARAGVSVLAAQPPPKKKTEVEPVVCLP